MSFSLINEAWIPVRRADGSQEKIAPWEITKNPDDNPIVSLAARRPDFNGALMQFLIGLLQTTFAPKEQHEWRKLLKSPPPPEQLKERFETVAHAFDLDGDGPRFMQDFDLADGEFKDISVLLIETPGGKTVRDNIDHFIKRGFVKGVCSSCAAVALFSMETNAPSGGVGHRTSLRGGGPLSTLVMFDPKSGKGLSATLWRNLWLNVLEKESFLALSGNRKKAVSSDIFPWMAKTRTSDKNGSATYQQDVHPAQMYWAMPRRIRLDFDKTGKGNCDICSQPSDRLISRYRTKNYGVNYEGAWQHPLSPYSKKEKDGKMESFPLHAQPGGISYRHWLGFVGTDSEKGVEPARVVTEFINHRMGQKKQLRIWVFGYDMDNMKARCWYESMMPIYQLEDEVRGDFEDAVKGMITAAVTMGRNLRGALKKAWFSPGAEVRGDLSFIDTAFWQDTESAFYGIMDKLHRAFKNGDDDIPLLREWFHIINRETLNLFDVWAMRVDIEDENPKRIALARRDLRMFNKKTVRKALKLDSEQKENKDE